MTLWFKKIVKCKLCGQKCRKKNTWQLHMNTVDGHHQITICNRCAETMEEMKGNIGTWLEK